MRLSVDDTDPGYSRLAFGVRVFLDGAEVKRVITADEERGLIVQHAVNEHGDLLWADRSRKQLRREMRYGDVRIEVPEGHPLNAQAERRP